MRQVEDKIEVRLERSKEETGKSTGSKLLSPGETTIPKLEESASQADFVRWGDELYRMAFSERCVEVRKGTVNVDGADRHNVEYISGLRDVSL